MKDSSINVAIVGLGSMGQKHYKVLQSIEDINIVGLVDSLGFDRALHRVYKNIEELIEGQKVDCAIIATPTSTHTKIAKKLLQNGIHTLIEKPVANNIVEATELVQIAEESNCKVAVGHIERFNPAVQCLIEDLKGQKILNCNITRVSPYLAIHDIDLIKFITNQNIVDIVSSCTSTKTAQEDTASFFLNLSGGSTGMIFTSWLIPFKERTIKLLTENSYYTINLINQQVLKYTCCGDKKFNKSLLFVEAGNALEKELKAFIKYVKIGEPGDLASLSYGIVALSLIRPPPGNRSCSRSCSRKRKTK